MKNKFYSSLKFKKRVKFLITSQFWSEKKIEKYQIENLKKLIFYVNKNIPYYNRYISNKKINIEKISSLEFLKLFPIINKKIIQKNLDLFVNLKNKKSLINRTTGGSTGTPLTVWSDNNFQIKDKANTIYYTKLFDIDVFKDNSIRLYGDKLPTSILKKKIFWYKKSKNKLIMSAFHINSETFEIYIRKILEFSPKYIHTRSSTIYPLARFAIESNHKHQFNIKYIFVDGEYLTSGQRHLIEKVFNTRVINIYGHTEGILVGHPCEYSNDLHFMPQNGILETLKFTKNNNKRVKLIATSFNNNVFPLIRYDTGDVGIISKTRCKCKRNYQTLKEIEGRQQDYVIDSKYNKIPLAPAIFNYNDMNWKGVEEFKVIQRYPGKLLFKIKKNPQYSTYQLTKNIEEKIGKIFGNKFKINTKIVKELKKTSIGKHRYLDQKVRIV